MHVVDYWGVMVGLGLLATAFGVVGFVRYRERESTTLQRQTQLARELRDLAGDDEVRLAAVDEFSLTIYHRLFYASVVAPWIRSAAWALLGAVLAGAGALAVGSLDGVFATVVHVATIVAAGVFGVSTLVYVGIALYHSATTPRVSFTDSYAGEDSDPDSAPSTEAASAEAPTAEAMSTEAPSTETPSTETPVSTRPVD
ncbi:hypothetical protein CYJ73_16640 [Gordonia terrae]|uniref:Uncharacterized protein n=1 Tax=Gordonia terrae TaxID=2055 RepID=A0A2I1R5T8_9ACTN|nr:hypothetical protein [Gordonia terrae]PKZ64496.1 hypothetical protein CYJ73_16640 [Gordonia terrae]